MSGSNEHCILIKMHFVRLRWTLHTDNFEHDIGDTRSNYNRWFQNLNLCPCNLQLQRSYFVLLRCKRNILKPIPRFSTGNLRNCIGAACCWDWPVTPCNILCPDYIHTGNHLISAPMQCKMTFIDRQMILKQFC